MNKEQAAFRYNFHHMERQKHYQFPLKKQRLNQLTLIYNWRSQGKAYVWNMDRDNKLSVQRTAGFCLSAADAGKGQKLVQKGAKLIYVY